MTKSQISVTWLKNGKHTRPLSMYFTDYSEALGTIRHTQPSLVDTGRHGDSKASHWTHCKSLLPPPSDHSTRSSRQQWVVFTGQGTRQGCFLSPSLFDICTEFIWEVLDGFDKVEGAGISIGGYLLTDLRYADDTTLLATTTDEMQQMLESVKQIKPKAINEDYGLFLNVTKTKCMYIDGTNKTRMQTIIASNR